MKIILFQVGSYKYKIIINIYFLNKGFNFYKFSNYLFKIKIFFDFDYYENLTTKLLKLKKLFHILNYNFNKILRLHCKLFIKIGFV